MRVLFVCPDLDVGGAERQWATLIRALAERGHEPGLLTLTGDGRLFHELAARGVPARCARLRARGDPRALRRALGTARWRPDVVVSRTVSGQIVGAAIARRARVPHVMNEHTPCLPDGRLLPTQRHQRLLTRLVAPRVDLVVAVSAAQTAPLGAQGYRRERIRVVANGVFPGRLRPTTEREAARAELGLEPEDFGALLVAALRPEKRVETFLRAVALARRSNPRLRGLVAGTGRELERIRAGAGEGIRLLGQRGDVPDLIAASDALCLTSAAEALPMVVLEAMALARPVVASDVGGVGEAVVPRGTGLLVEPGSARGFAEALLALCADPRWARALGEAGRARQRERFDGERMVDGYLRALEEARAGP